MDTRVSAPAPAIGVQNFGYALQEECWHARVGSLQPFFDAVGAERGIPSHRDEPLSAATLLIGAM